MIETLQGLFFLLFICYIIILPTINTYIMTAEKIIELFEQVKEFIDKIIKIYNDIADKINKYLSDIEVLINNVAHHSEQYIKIKLYKIFDEIDKAIAGLKKKISNLVKQVNSCYDRVVNIIKTQIIIFNAAKAGIPMSKSQASAAAEAIPHPALAIPNFEIKLVLPNLKDLINLDSVTSINLPRVSLIG